MPRLKIFGKVEPPWLRLTVNIRPTVHYRIDEADLDIDATLVMEQSDITVTCEVNRWDDGVLAWLLPYVSDWVHAEVDLFTFASGKVLHVHLDRAEYPDASERQLIGEAPDLAAIATACATNTTTDTVVVDMGTVLPIILGNPTLMLALHDLCSAVKYGNNTATACARAIEGMRKALWSGPEADNAERMRSWAHFRAVLNLSETYLKAITDASRGPRHGSSEYIPSATRQEVLHRSWTVMNRVLVFLRDGSNALAPSDYPLL